jgi:gamma-glutamyl-gamma-aminobutyrate hydrolase PuuD
MKKILIVGWKTGENSFGITLPYAEYFSQFGNIEIITPTETEVRKGDLLVLPGGPDVSPNRYLGQQQMSFYMGTQCPFRERFDNVLLPKYIESNIPIFGICRGHQSLAVYFGGSLCQHYVHEKNTNDRTELVHEVTTFNKKKFKTNSIHHQHVEVVPSNATVIAYHSEDKIVEALKYNNKPIASVQWHPEEIHDEFSTNLIIDLLTSYERQARSN